MDKLLECRKEINEIDSKIIELFEKRMDVVKEIANYKLENGIPVLDTSRENILYEKNVSKLNNEKYKEFYTYVFQGFLNASKKFQQEIIDENVKK